MTVLKKLRSHPHPVGNHNPRQNCLMGLYFWILRVRETCQIQIKQTVKLQNRI